MAWVMAANSSVYMGPMSYLKDGVPLTGKWRECWEGAWAKITPNFRDEGEGLHE